MNEKTFILETIHPSALYGRNNPFLPLITNAFPQLKIVARGEQIKVQGAPEHIARFEEKLDCLVNIYERKQHLSEESIRSVLEGVINSPMSTEGVFDDVLVYGNNGR